MKTMKDQQCYAITLSFCAVAIWSFQESSLASFNDNFKTQWCYCKKFWDFKWYLLQPCLSSRWRPIWLIHNLHTLPLITTTHCHRHLIVQNDQSAFVVPPQSQPGDTWCNHTKLQQVCSQPNQDICLWLQYQTHLLILGATHQVVDIRCKLMIPCAHPMMWIIYAKAYVTYDMFALIKARCVA